MKRPRTQYLEKEVDISYPPILFVVMDRINSQAGALVLHPYMADPCERLLIKLRADDDEGETALAFLSSYSIRFRAHYTAGRREKLNQVCLADTLKNKICLLEAIEFKQMCNYGRIQVEYIKISAPLSTSRSPGSSSSSEEEEETSSSEETIDHLPGYVDH